MNGAVTLGLLKSLEDKMGASRPGSWGQRSGHQTEDLPPPFRADTQAKAEDVAWQMSPHLAPHLTQQLTCKHHHHSRGGYSHFYRKTRSRTLHEIVFTFFLTYLMQYCYTIRISSFMDSVFRILRIFLFLLRCPYIFSVCICSLIKEQKWAERGKLSLF